MTDLDVAIRLFKENGKQIDVTNHFHFLLWTACYSYVLTIRYHSWELYARNLYENKEEYYRGKSDDDFSSTIINNNDLESLKNMLFSLNRYYTINEILNQI